MGDRASLPRYHVNHFMYKNSVLHSNKSVLKWTQVSQLHLNPIVQKIIKFPFYQCAKPSTYLCVRISFYSFLLCHLVISQSCSFITCSFHQQISSSMCISINLPLCQHFSLQTCHFVNFVSINL